MTFSQFSHSIISGVQPLGIRDELLAMWFDARNHWERAHDLVQNSSNDLAMRIHAYLHRKEGDLRNADYWYQKAGRTRPDISLQTERTQIVRSILASDIPDEYGL